MKLFGTFVFVSCVTREKDGKVYANVNLEFEDGKVMNISTDPEVAKGMQKYRRHQGEFDVGSYQGSMYIRLVSASPVQSK